MNEPLNGAITIFNEFSDVFEFGGSRDGFWVRIKERMVDQYDERLILFS
jgi:hypothetical protein